MLITGFQKSTLLDYPGKVAALIFTYGCNLRCEYCHNPELVTIPCVQSTVIPEEYIFSFLKQRNELLDAVAITGGEPTLQKDLITFIQKIKDLDLLVKLDTNGTNSKIVKEILDLDIVDYWAMDIKYEEEIYKQNLKGKIEYEEIEKSIELLMNMAKDYEFRTTYVKGIHTLNSAKGIGRLIKGSKRYYIQNFRPGKTINPGLNNTNSFTPDELIDIEKIVKKYVKEVEIRN
ncbi:anaerobic ribonucleoside-triphosphate reductase activating protein [candidate division WS6 bacterium RIFOXYD1_FULL_33_8]|nr:MAG: anaerobic ribonucleoside-triphosphate reductase activating protein [candidate division WS6 bacterium RIFOXYB1_FULL_33_15]OGC37023.1 MAG: anaerobic ribonucleoside-triphosphate reductase activating protein [candidate division WS6 bacterium RIFOXYC1_FULL_33_9]OGC42974.1 MAG: anaerobic ribonucleoside-triphosphate reductase activating protein [candidate division WS6 bacterium RIFOXYD1_FULL_33_8]